MLVQKSMDTSITAMNKQQVFQNKVVLISWSIVNHVEGTNEQEAGNILNKRTFWTEHAYFLDNLRSTVAGQQL